MRRLLIRPGAIGDTITWLPALECLRADYTEVWAPGANLPLIRCAHRVRSIASTGIELLGLPEFSPAPQLLRALAGFDCIDSWYGTNRPEFRDALAELHRGVRFHVALPAMDSCLHAVDFFLAQAGCRERFGAAPGIEAPPCQRERFAVFQPFSGARWKNWPLDRFKAVAERLPIQVRWTAGPEETLGALEQDAVRFDDLYELACWLSRAQLYLGNDSGISHLAAAVGTPVVALFGPTEPRVWAPRGPSVRVLHKASLEEISVEEVAETVRALC